MPFKHNASRRHHIPKARRRITNWPAYESGLRRRGDVTFYRGAGIGLNTLKGSSA